MLRPTLHLRAALAAVAALVAVAWTVVPCTSPGTLPQARAADVAAAHAERPRPPRSDAEWRRLGVKSDDAEDRDGLDDDDDELDELRKQVPALLSVVLVRSRPVRPVPTRLEPARNSPGSRLGPPPRMPPA